jgi:NADP-dependent 3-hydroxy acid dehydrogenase YdfG
MTTKCSEQEIERLVIISGASRGIGKAFADYYRTQANMGIIGISHSDRLGLVRLDLLDEPKVNNFIEDLNLNKFKDIIYIHGIGIDKFEPDAKPHIDYDGDGIDDEVYASNVTAFRNIAEPLIEKVKQIQTPLTICNIGSISDIYQVPFWQSFSRSKNIIRKYLKSLALIGVKSITLNVSSTLDGENRKYGRVNADTTYWQTANNLVTKSINSLEGMRTLDSTYAEFDFYKHNPNFRQDYFTDLPKLFASWQKDLGYAGKEVPHGIRI